MSLVKTSVHIQLSSFPACLHLHRYASTDLFRFCEPCIACRQLSYSVGFISYFDGLRIPLIDYLVNIQQMKMAQMQQSSSQQQDQLQQQQLQQVVLAYAYLITGAHFRS